MDTTNRAPTSPGKSQSTAGPIGGKTAPTRLSELLKVDQAARWRRGDPLTVETYLERHPSLKNDPESLLELVWNEVELREEQGAHPQLDEFIGRFNQLAEPLRLLFQSPGTQVLDMGQVVQPEPAADCMNAPVIPGYEIIREIGRGGMGVVYLARQTVLKRQVALKMILAGGHSDSIARQRFRTEAEAVARLAHPNIVPIFEIGECAGQPFLCFEYVDGGNLETPAARAMPDQDLARLVELLALAVHHTHQRGILHRDLKPSNVLLTADGVPKITDFGLAKLMDDAGGPTRTESLIGTPNYMSPEQAAGHSKQVGVGADVYSLGAILYELLTGRAPFRGTSVLNVLEQVRNKEPAPPRRFRASTAPDLETICLKCLEKNPAGRYATAELLAADLRRFQDGKPIAARPIPHWQQAWRFLRRRPAVVARLAAGIALVCAALACLGYYWAAHANRQSEALKAGQRDEQKFRRFTELYDEAIVNGMLSPDRGSLFVGIEATARLQAAESAAHKALAIARVDPDSPEPGIDPEFIPSRRAEIWSDCHALLMVLASVKAQQSPSPSDAEEALRILDVALRFGEPTHAFHLRRASILNLAGKAEASAREIRLAESIPPVTATDFFLIGEDQYRQGRCDEAASSFGRALAIQPNHFWAQFFLAACQLKAQHWEAARAGLNACLSRRPDFAWAYLFRSFAHEKLREFDNAQNDFASALQLDLSDDERYVLLLTRGIFHFNQNALDSAEADFQEAIGLKPDQFNAYLNLAAVQLKKGQFQQAAGQVEKAMSLRPPSQLLFDYQLTRGRCLLQAKRFAEAIDACKMALEILPNQPLPLEVEARAQLQFGHFAEAEQLIDEYLLKAGPATADVFRGRGLARMKQGRYAEAAEDYTRVVERAPNAEIYRHRGWAYFFADAWKLGLRDFSRAIDMDAESGDAHAGRGLCRVMLGEYQDAARDAETALKCAPDTPETMHNIACIFAQSAARAEADSTDRDRQTRAADFRSRAIKALRQAIDMVPSGERRAFWHDKVFPDKALIPILDSPEFIQLAKEYADS